MGMWVTPGDVRKRWVIGSLDASDEQIETKIRDAEDVVLSEFPDVQARVDGEALRVDTLVRVVAGMVVRFFRNPEGLRTTGETVGPHSIQSTVTYGGDEPGELYLTDADRSALAGRARQRKAFTIMPRYQ